MDEEEFEHTYTVPNFALAFPYLDLSKPADEVFNQIRGIASYGVFSRERSEKGKKLQEMNVQEMIKRRKK